MTQPQIILAINDEQGHRERVVESARFTIGSDLDNDLVMVGSGVSRRHALIEHFEGVVQLSDCGSEAGTVVNGKLVRGSVALKDGDAISIGPVCRIGVGIDHARPQHLHAAASKPAAPLGTANRRKSRAARRLGTPVIALVAGGLILFVAVPLAALLNKGGRVRESRAARVADPRGDAGNKPALGPRPSPDERGPKAGDDSTANAVTIEQVEAVAAQFMRRISSDDRPYVFPPYAVKGLDDIKQQVEQFRASPGLAGALDSIASAGPALAAEARREGVEPGLIIFTALVEGAGARPPGDPAAIARRVLPEMLSLKKTLGTESADKSLILVAAYRMGGGTKKSHPLLQTMRRLVKNPLTDRNVWYLREHGGLDDHAYNFVVSFLALGLIAENPRRFGIAAAPIVY